jgi:hypothetical protein
VVGDVHEDEEDSMRRTPLSGIVRAAWRLARELPDPENDPDLAAFCIQLRLDAGRDARELPPETWENQVLDAIVAAIVEGWDRHGAPSVARDPSGPGYIGSAEGPGEGIIVHAPSKRAAYAAARTAWLRRILATTLGLGEAK